MVKTFKEVGELYLNKYFWTVQESTFLKTRRLFLNHFYIKFGEREIDSITTDEIQTYLNNLSKKYVTYKKMYCHLKNCFSFAVQEEFIAENPCSDEIIQPRDFKLKQNKKKFLSIDELKSFLALVKAIEDSKIYTFFRLLAVTGMRSQEILALTWDDVDYNEKCIDVNKAVSVNINNKPIISKTKNASSIRLIPIDNTTLNLLKEWQDLQRKNLLNKKIKLLPTSKQLIFPNSKNEIQNALFYNKKITEICINANLRHFSLHTLRHTHCSILIESGANIKEVQFRMGHSDINTTLKIYTHVMSKKGHLSQIIENLLKL